MGKGTIKSGGDSGQYQVEINYDKTAYDKEVARLIAGILDLENKILEYETQGRIFEADSLKLRKASLEKRKEYIERNIPIDETISAWCCDLSENLSGIVGTIEVPGEVGIIQIKPGYDEPGYTPTDGQLAPTITLSPCGVFYNLAMLPGWQKWKPTFRYATIDSINGDIADITYDVTTSSQQGLNISQTETASGVDIEYMSCNGGAFSKGDVVLVMFGSQDWSQPKIIGFKDNPKSCNSFILVTCVMGTGSGERKDVCFVWDLETNSYNNTISDNNGELVSFPVEVDVISKWLNNRSSTGSSAVTTQGGAYEEYHKSFNPSWDDYDNPEDDPRCSQYYTLNPYDFCYHCHDSAEEEYSVRGFDYLGEIEHTGLLTTEYNNYGNDDFRDVHHNVTRTQETPINGLKVPSVLITSSTAKGGVRGRTASMKWEEFQAEHNFVTDVCPYEIVVGLYGDVPCSILIETIDYTFTSPFSDHNTNEVSLYTEQKAPYYPYWYDPFPVTRESFKEQTYVVQSTMSDKIMIVFYYEELLILQKNRDVDLVTTYDYRMGIEFNIKAFSQVMAGEETTADINPFELPENSNLSSALKNLKEYAQSFSGQPLNSQCSRPSFSLSMIQ